MIKYKLPYYQHEKGRQNMKSKKLLSALMAVIMTVSSLAAAGAEESAEPAEKEIVNSERKEESEITEKLTVDKVKTENDTDDEAEEIEEESDAEEEPPKEENGSEEESEETKAENGTKEEEASDDEKSEEINSEISLFSANEYKPCGNEDYELIYYNSFDTDEEAAINPIKEFYYSDKSIKSAPVSNGSAETKFCYPSDSSGYRAVFIDLAKDLKNENGKMLLSAGGVYEISFDVTALKSNLSLNFGCVSELNVNTVKTGVGLAPPKKGMGIGLDNTFYKENTVKNETKEIRLIVVYNPTNRYLAAAYNGWYDGTAQIDNLTVRTIDIDDEYLKANCEKWYNKFNSESALTMTKIASVDLSETQKVLKKGTETDLIAYSQTMSENATIKDIITKRTLIDNADLKVESEDEDIIAYADGKLRAVGVGTSIVKVAGSGSETSMLCTVYDGDDNYDYIAESNTTWIKTKNPVNGLEEAFTSNKIASVSTGLYADSSTVNLHYTKYFNGTDAALEYAANPFGLYKDYYTWDITNVWMSSKNDAVRKNFTDSINIGWNDFDFIMRFKDSLKIQVYVNGIFAGNMTLFNASPSKIKGKVIDIYPNDSSWDTYKEFKLISLKNSIKPEDVTITKDNGEVMTINDISKIFSDSPSVPMPVSGGFEILLNNVIDKGTLGENVVITDETGNEIEIKINSENGRTIKIVPEKQLKFNSKYTLKFKSGLKVAGKEDYAAEDGQTVDFSFTTEKKPFTYDKLTVNGKTLSVEGLANNREYEQTATLIMAAYSGDKCVDISVKSVTLGKYEKSEKSIELGVNEDITEYEFFAWNSVTGNDLKSLNMDSVILDTARSEVSAELLNGSEAYYNVYYNAQTKKVTVTGQTKNKMSDMPVAIRIVPNGETPSESNILRIEEIKTANDGAVGYAFGFDGETDKLYDVYINVNGEETAVCSFGYTSEDNAAAALKKINDCSASAQILNVIGDVRKTLGLVNDGYENVEAKSMICGTILKGKPYDTASGGVELFVKNYNKALALAKLLDNADQNTSDTIVNNNTYWGIEKTSAYSQFQKLSDNDKTEVYKTMKKADDLSGLNSAFATGVIIRAVLAQASYSSVYATMKEFDDIMTLDTKDYGKLTSKQQQNVCAQIVSEAASFASVKSIEDRFAELSAKEIKKETGTKEPPKTSGGSSYSDNKKTSAGDDYNGVKVLPGTTQTTNPKPDWYVDETATESFTVFKDLENFDWAVSSIKKLYESGAINGKSEGIFAPGDMITREELCKIITAAMGISKKDGAESISFADVDPNAWYAPYIDICSSRGIINGIGDNNFGVGRYVTREEAATILVRAAEAAGKSLDYYVTIFPFDDDDQISDWARSSIETLRECQVINGVSETEAIFAPKNNVTRAAASKMIVGVMNFSY